MEVSRRGVHPDNRAEVDLRYVFRSNVRKLRDYTSICSSPSLIFSASAGTYTLHWSTLFNFWKVAPAIPVGSGHHRGAMLRRNCVVVYLRKA